MSQDRDKAHIDRSDRRTAAREALMNRFTSDDASKQREVDNGLASSVIVVDGEALSAGLPDLRIRFENKATCLSAGQRAIINGRPDKPTGQRRPRFLIYESADGWTSRDLESGDERILSGPAALPVGDSAAHLVPAQARANRRALPLVVIAVALVAAIVGTLITRVPTEEAEVALGEILEEPFDESEVWIPLAADPLGEGCNQLGYTAEFAAEASHLISEQLATTTPPDPSPLVQALTQASECAEHYGHQAEVDQALDVLLQDPSASSTFLRNVLTQQTAPALILTGEASIKAGSTSSALNEDLGALDLRMSSAISQLAIDRRTVTRIDPDQLVREAFLAFLAAPAIDHWVNLNPSQPDIVLGPALQGTEAGRVMLEADHLLKKGGTAETRGNIQAALRNDAEWASCGDRIKYRMEIEPDGPATLAHDQQDLFVLDLPLTVEVEVLEGFSSELCQTPKVLQNQLKADLVRAVNHSPHYAELRLVYYARVLADWYRSTGKDLSPSLAPLLDSNDTSPWPTEDPDWHHQQVFDAYVEDYAAFGGVNFTDQSIADLAIDAIEPYVEELADVIPLPDSFSEAISDTIDHILEEISDQTIEAMEAAEAVLDGYAQDVRDFVETTQTWGELANNVGLVYDHLPEMADEAQEIVDRNPVLSLMPGVGCLGVIGTNRSIGKAAACGFELFGDEILKAGKVGKAALGPQLKAAKKWIDDVVEAGGAKASEIAKRLGPKGEAFLEGLKQRAAREAGTRGPEEFPDLTRIFRAVEPDELADLQRSGQFRLGGPNAQWQEGKYFWLAEEHADAYVDLATKSNFGGPYCVASGCIPSDVLAKIEVVTMDGNPAVFIPEDLLPLIADLRVPGG